MQSAAVAPKAALNLRRGYPWVYRTELKTPPAGAAPGSIVRVEDLQHNSIGLAFYATKSPIALRMLTRPLVPGAPEEPIDDAFFKERIKRSIQRRWAMGNRDAVRLVHAEADLLPGLFVDKYGEGLVIQTLCEGAWTRRELFARLLVELTGAKQVIARDDGSGRDFEGLPREVLTLHGGSDAARYVFHEGQTEFEVDLMADMKTGSFLDQVDNHVRAGELGRGDALDCFSYHGGFALSLARNCTSVTAVEWRAFPRLNI